jgi:predicted nucleotidyltransferase
LVEDINLRKKFDTALEMFIDRIKSDTSILAVFVLGSYTNGVLWEKSDIDMVIVTNEERVLQDLIIIHENGVQINAYLISRNSYRRNQQRFLQGSMMHHMLSTSKLIYSIEKGISNFNRDMFSVADRDKELQIMLSCEFLVGCLHKLKKSLYVENSMEKAFSWLILATTHLSRILIFLKGKIPGRDVITQAKEISDQRILNDIVMDVFKVGYSGENLESSINMIETFLIKNLNSFYKPLYEYLNDSMGERTHTELDVHFRKITNFPNLTLVESIIWLTDQGILMTGVKPKRITARSRVTVDEVTVYYIGNGV